MTAAIPVAAGLLLAANVVIYAGAWLAGRREYQRITNPGAEEATR